MLLVHQEPLFIGPGLQYNCGCQWNVVNINLKNLAPNIPNVCEHTIVVSCLTLTCLLLELKSEGLRIEYLKFDRPSELRNDFQRCLR